MLDYLIKGGTIVDGTGAARYRGDVGIKDGRITAVGNVDQAAKETIDASGLVVAPGFVDIHTHYDAQVFWDPALSPSCYHGVTSMFAGNCGFSVAPLTAEGSDYLMRMLARVEGMPLQSLRDGVPWNWTSFGSYLERVQEQQPAVNIGFLVGHSALRRAVMGAAAVDQPSTPQQLAAMQQLLHQSLAEGGMGFSSSQAPTHNDGGGHPVPSRAADGGELIALSSCLRDHPGTLLEFIPTVGPFEEKHMQLMTDMSLAAQRSLNWNVLIVNTGARAIFENQIQAADYAAARGATIRALTFAQPVSLRLNLLSGFGLDALPGWAAVLGLPVPERMRALADPATRARMIESAAHPDVPVLLRAMGNFSAMTIEQTFAPATKAYQGRALAEVAAERGQSAADAFFDGRTADLLPAPTRRRRRGELGAARRDVEGSPDPRRRLRRRRPSRHDRYLRLQHHGTGRRRAQARTTDPGGRRAPDHRSACALHGPEGTWPYRPGLARRSGGVRSGARRQGQDGHALRPARRRRAPLLRGRGHPPGDGQRYRDRARQPAHRAAPGAGAAFRP